jgi:hypothetical protein
MTIAKDSGALSIDFIVGFTIFLIAFIWVVSLVPGLLINLQGYSIDYDAVTYRTGVILVEDPGSPSDPTSPWESQIDPDAIDRFGLAISRDTPNILSQEKVERFFCETATSTFPVPFTYPSDYQDKAIFGDPIYRFNISLRDVDRDVNRSKGDVLPKGYGYIRHLVKIKGGSNATIDGSSVSPKFNNTDQNVTSHQFSILIDPQKLYSNMTEQSYQIDPAREPIVINITNLKSTMSNPGSNIELTSISVTSNNPTSVLEYSSSGNILLIDNLKKNSTNPTEKFPQNVTNNISITFSPKYFRDDVWAGVLDEQYYLPVYVNLSFKLSSNSTFLNNSWSSPFEYNYDPNNVTQPHLRDAVVEVAVW